MRTFGLGSGFVGFTLLATFGCGTSSPEPQEQFSSASQALTNNSGVLGFEHPLSDWTVTNLNLRESDVRVSGNAAAQLTIGTSGGTLTSVPLSSLGKISSVVTAQLRLPSYLAGQTWQGQVALRLNAPSAGCPAKFAGSDVS
jgi:hypothetical protein